MQRAQKYGQIEKRILRNKFMQQRDAMANDSVFEKSNQIVSILFEQQIWQIANHIHCYKSKGREVITEDIINRAEQEGKKVWYPGEYSSSNWPKTDLAIVPGVLFDNKGNRIGRGGGWYDKLLSSIVSYSIGLAYDYQIVEDISTEEHDVAVDMIITESRVI